jgi:hypothetical protein
MSKDSNIKSYTAIDIEKYHKGLLSPREMHDLEKAALDDPFLADALEGYSVPGINAAADIAELKKRLSDRTEENRKVIPLASPPRSSFPWLRAAAMLILVLGAGFLVYQFGFNNDSASSPFAKSEYKNVAEKMDSNQSSNNTMPDSDRDITVSQKPATDSSVSTISGATDNLITIPGEQKAEAKAAQRDIVAVPDTVALAIGKSDDNYYKSKDLLAVSPPPPAKNDVMNEPSEKKLEFDKSLRRKNEFATQANPLPLKEQKAEGRNLAAAKMQTDTSISVNGYAEMEAAAPNRGNAIAKQSNVAADELNNKNAGKANVFRGQVIDADNNVVPFANITNRADNIGTYTDAKGNFLLTSPDSVLNVQVRSLGYENNNSQLNNRQLNNQVVMQEDRSLKEVVVSQKKVNSTRSRTSTMVLEEPEPVDGWTNYDAYLANNLNVPETWRSKQTEGSGAVTLSFEVNSKGQPVNISVEKSLCESCDREAIRLIKEGPKWKRKSRKGRTSVTVTF